MSEIHSNLQFFGFCGTDFAYFQAPDGKFWFRASEVCLLLGFSNTYKTVMRHAEHSSDEFQVGMGRPALYVTEPGLYRLIFKSKDPIAQVFQDLIFDDVLPSIRRDGLYISPGVTPSQAQAGIARLNSILAQPDPWERLASAALIDRIHEFYGQQCSETFWWKYVYHWMTPEERGKLDELNPIQGKARQRKTRIHQWVSSEDEIKARLKENLAVVVNIIMASASRTAFEDNMRRLAGFDQKSLFG